MMDKNNREKIGADSAPMWLYEGETYGLWYSDLASAEQIEPYKAFPFIDWGQPASNIKWVDEFHKINIRSIAYVSFYKAPNIPQVEDRRKWEGGSPGSDECQKNPFWQAVDLSKHPEWTLIAQDGALKRPFNNPAYPPGWYQVCTNVEGYAEAVLEGVKGIMEMGFDGLFIDNVHPEAECYATEHSKHKHIYPDKNNDETYKMLLSKIRPLVKSYGQDKAVVLNSGGVRKEYFSSGDGLMWESYIFGGAERRHDWPKIKQSADEFKPYIESGKTLLALSYVGGETPEQYKNNTFYAYACARLSGFLWARSSLFDKVRIGIPAGDIQEKDGIYYRMYSKGIVAVNPEPNDNHVQIPVGVGCSKVLNLYSDEILQVRGGLLDIYLPADSGRIYNQCL